MTGRTATLVLTRDQRLALWRWVRLLAQVALDEGRAEAYGRLATHLAGLGDRTDAVVLVQEAE